MISDKATAIHDVITQAQIWRVLINKIAKERNIDMLIVSHNPPLHIDTLNLGNQVDLDD